MIFFGKKKYKEELFWFMNDVGIIGTSVDETSEAQG